MLRRCATPFVSLVALAAAIELLGCTPADEKAGATDPCGDLRRKTCGDNDECADQGWCAAAKLLAEIDPSGARCTTALADDASYPICTHRALAAGACDQLINLACGMERDGGARPCDGDSTCVNAVLLAAQPDAGTADAAAREARCQAALYETSLYPACPR